MGHTLLAISDAAVNWKKSAHWAGVCGKFTPQWDPQHRWPQEVAHAVYNALTMPTASAYERVGRMAAA